MRTEHEERRTVQEPLPRLEPEREVAFVRVGRRVGGLWWLVAAAVAAGAIAGYLAARLPHEIDEPRAAIYAGALVGLLAGLVLALAWEPLLGRRARGGRAR